MFCLDVSFLKLLPMSSLLIGSPQNHTTSCTFYLQQGVTKFSLGLRFGFTQRCRHGASGLHDHEVLAALFGVYSALMLVSPHDQVNKLVDELFGNVVLAAVLNPDET